MSNASSGAADFEEAVKEKTEEDQPISETTGNEKKSQPAIHFGPSKTKEVHLDEDGKPLSV